MKICTHADSDVEVAVKGSRLANFMGELRREKNGAVADFMRFYGEKYGLNYGVSLPTIRQIARCDAAQYDVAVNHKFAKLLYQQEVRELRLSALWMADIEQVNSPVNLDFWARGIINSEVAEEAAFAFLYKSDLVVEWLNSDNSLLQYCAIMSEAKRLDGQADMMSEWLTKFADKLRILVENEPHIIPKAVVALLDTAVRSNVDRSIVMSFINSFSENSSAASFIKDEMAWRLEFC